MNESNLIKERLSLMQYLSGKSMIKKGGGKIRVNPCPFCGHNDCFTLFEQDDRFYCFSCKSGGDIFDYVMKESGTDFNNTLKFLADRAGVDIKQTKDIQKKYHKKEETQKIFTASVEYYKTVLSQNKEALKYLKTNRKRNEFSIKKTRYGLADGKLTSVMLKDFSKEALLESGMCKEKGGKVFDFFAKGVFVYPIYFNKKIVDFVCKDYFEKVKEKKREYQLPNEKKLSSPLFYGKDAILADSLVITEGPEDRISILQNYDIPVCAVLGQMSAKQYDYIEAKCSAKKVYLAFDNDTKGAEYEKEVVRRLIGNVPIFKLIFDAKDIDDELKASKNPEERMKEIIDASPDILKHYMNELPEMKNMVPQIREGYVDPILFLISKFENEITRMHYIEYFADIRGSKTRYLMPMKRQIHEMRTGTTLNDEEDIHAGVLEKNNRYYYANAEKGSLKKISEFVIRIVSFIEINDEIYYECSMINSSGNKSQMLIFSSAERVNKKAFREKVAGAGKGFYFMGSDNELVEVWQKEEMSAKIDSRTCYFQRYGYLKKHGVWLFANCAVQGNKVYEAEESNVVKIGDIAYLSKNVNVYGGDIPKINTSFKVTDEWIIDVKNKFSLMMDGHNESFKGNLLLGYLACVAYLEEIIAFERTFPYMLIYGQSGTGKSEVMQLWMNCFGFTHGGENWGESTAVGIAMAVEQLSCIPYWCEEYKNVLGNNHKQDNKVQLVKNIYNRTSAGKGGLDHRSSREVNGVIVFTGQDRPEEKAFLSRVIILSKEMPVTAGTEAYFSLKAERQNLSALFLNLIKKKKKKDKKIKDVYKEYYQAVKIMIDASPERGKIDERALYNYTIVACMYEFAFGYLFPEEKQLMIKWVADEIIEDISRKAKEDVLYRFFEDIEVIFQFRMGEICRLADGVLYLHFNTIYHEWKKEAARSGTAEYMSRNGLLDYMRKDNAGYFLGFDRCYFPAIQSQQRCVKLALDKLPDNLNEIVKSWGENEKTVQAIY